MEKWTQAVIFPPLWINAWNRLLRVRCFVYNKHFLMTKVLILVSISYISPKRQTSGYSCAWGDGLERKDGLCLMLLVGKKEKKRPMMVCAGKSYCRDKPVSSISWSVNWNPLFPAPARHASCWSNVRSSYVFRNLTPPDRLITAADSLSMLQAHHRIKHCCCLYLCLLYFSSIMISLLLVEKKRGIMKKKTCCQ